MKQVTRNIGPHLVQDLLERVPHACLSFAGEHGPQVLPVDVFWQNNRCLVGIPADAGGSPTSGQEAVLLVDEGIYYFDLRAIYTRGQVQPGEVPPGARVDGCYWFELIPTKTVAWNYDSMQEVNAGDERLRSCHARPAAAINGRSDRYPVSQ